MGEERGSNTDHTPRPDGGGTSLLDEIPWRKALLFGVVAFVAGMVLMTGLIAVEAVLDDTPEDPGADELDEDEPGFVTSVGWLYFNAQFVDLELSWALGTESVSMLDEEADELSIPTVVYYLVPIVVLLGAGNRLAKRTLPNSASPEEGAKRGATVAIGYLLAVILGSQLFTWRIEEDGVGVSASVAFTEAVLVSGLIYPLMLGAIGGYLAFRE